jgi:hypothetical protein
MYNIHGLKNGHYVPLVFTLLSGKSELVYRKMWTSVASICKGLDLYLSPETIDIDFEVSMHNVLRDILTNSRIICCRFHLGQAWCRKIQVLGLSPQYKENNSEVGKWLNDALAYIFSTHLM